MTLATAFQLRSMVLSDACLLRRLVGGGGAVLAVSVGLQEDVPLLFLARTESVYSVLAVRPMTVWLAPEVEGTSSCLLFTPPPTILTS